MKKIVIVVVVLVAVLLLAPFGVGRLAESRLNKGLDKLVAQAPYFVIADRKWDGGWFKSEQLVTFEVSETWAKMMDPGALKEMVEAQAAADAAAANTEGEAEAPMPETNPESVPEGQESAGEEPAPDAPAAPTGEPVRFTIRNEVLHGPVLGLSGFGLARVDTHLDLPEDIKAKITEVFGPKPAFTTRTRVHFFGGATTTLTSEGRTIKPKESEGGGEFTYDTFKVSVGVSRNANEYDVDGGMKSASGKGADGGSFSLTGFTVDGKGKRVLGDLYEGDFAFKVKEIKAAGAGDPEGMLIQDVQYIVEGDSEGDFMDFGIKMGTGAFKTKEFTAMGLDVKEIHYDFSLRHLHVPTMDKFMKSWRDMYAAPMLNVADIENAVFAPMKEHGTELLKHDPVFAIDNLGLVTPEGVGILKGTIKFVGVTAEDFAVAGGMGVIGKLDADLTIEVAQKLAEKFPNGATMAGAAVDGGYATREGDKLVCKILFKNGELTVNGKPQAIPGLGGPPPGAMEEGAGVPDAEPAPGE